ncbi:MAG: hypothetical protein ABI134_08980 [Byssovorax sp.]
MLSRPLLLLAGAVALLGTTAGCTGLTKPESISISAEPGADAPAAKPGQAKAPSAERPAPPPAMPEPAQAGCGE